MKKVKRSIKMSGSSKAQPTPIEQMHLMMRQLIDVLAGECLGGDAASCSLEALQFRSHMRRSLDMIGVSIDLMADAAKEVSNV